jgi:hypothetical protein
MPTNPTLTEFTKGDLVISISGDGDGSGTYTDNQASPLTLEEVTTTGAIVGELVLPQTTTVVNGTTEYAFSAEYGSSSEGALQLSADGQSLVIAGYGINAQTYNAGGAAVYGNAALAQTTSIPGSSVTAVARVIADISYNATIDTSTALYNVDNTNNPRSVATVNGTSFYLSGQGVKGDTTQGVFVAHDGASSATAIDTSTDTRTVEIVNGVLYVSRDSTQGAGGTSSISSYGSLPSGTTAATPLSGIDGKLTLTAGETNSVNGSAIGTLISLSPEAYFFADANTLYIADSGNPKQGGLGDGGLQKWIFDGTNWNLAYTLSAGLNLVPNTASAGTTGLIGLTGTVVDGVVELYATNATINDLDQTYLFGISDTLAATTLPTDESFITLVTAAPDTNIRGISFAPSAAAATPTVTTITSGTQQTGITITSGSSLVVQSGGTINSATILSGGTATISAGGTDNNSSIANGATETVLGTANGDEINGTQLVSAATAIVSNETVYNGGVVDLYLKGAVANNLTLTNGGVLNISGNATANNTVISGGGTINFQSPKAVLGGTLTFDGPGLLEITAITSSGYGDLAVISGFGAGDYIDETLIGSGAVMTTSIVNGNTVATITSGTAIPQTFIFAGTTIGPSLSLIADGTGGEEIGFSTPIPVSTTVSSGQTSAGLTVTSGSTLTVQAGGTIANTTILSGGTAIVTGTDNNAVISSGGNETLLGSANADQIYGTQLISAAGAVASNETVYAGGVIDLFLKGGTVSNLAVSGGTLNINGNATALNTTITGGGVIDLQSPKANLTGTLTFAGAGTLKETAVISAGFGDLAVISGFGTGDSIDVTGMGSGATLSSVVSGGNTVETITSAGVSQSFIFAGTYAAGFFGLASDGGAGMDIVAAGTPCYCPGTLILTDRGDVAVEALRIGDRLVTHSGAIRPIHWIGHRTYSGRFAAGQKQILPIRIVAGALGDGLPRRDLMVSPLHAMFIDGLLIPASALVNGTTITQLRTVDRIEYFHIELETHDVILAEGAPAESFLDDQSRGMFHNAHEYAALYPDAEPAEALYCAPRVEDGEALEAIRRRLATVAPVRPVSDGDVLAERHIA